MLPGFRNVRHRVRQIGWATAFLGLLAALLLPAILVSARLNRQITIYEQAALIAVATLSVQAMRRRPIWEVTGRPGALWLQELALGSGLGTILMLVPAIFLWASGLVSFHRSATDLQDLASPILLMAGVAIAEELLFRGLLFQRLIDAFGEWPAQLLIAALFTLTHLGNPGMVGATKLWAGTNIFLASIMFGLAYLRTRSLALPIGMHFMANVTQGILLGFGVSGEREPRLLAPHISRSTDWLTGGAFGLEASLPGLLSVVIMTVLLAYSRWRAGADSRQRNRPKPLR